LSSADYPLFVNDLSNNWPYRGRMTHTVPYLSPHRCGFTLVELSIVLVIIGLLAGGIMVGRDMVEAALIRKQVTQIEQIDVAVQTFKTKYNCLPADCPDASADGLPMGEYEAYGNTNVSASYNANGDGDGIIKNYPLSSINGSGWKNESPNFFAHLRGAGLWNGEQNCYSCIVPATDYCGPVPPAASGGSYGALTSGVGGGVLFLSSYFYNGSPLVFYGSHYITTSAVPPLGSPNCTMSPANIKAAMTPIRSYNIDIKIDDGLPQSGKVVAISYTTNGATNGPSPVLGAYNNCGTATAYSITGQYSNVASCDLGFRMSF
jgi:prepilin-type N-terminal cleavage/methylation domain-containing protein